MLTQKQNHTLFPTKNIIAFRWSDEQKQNPDADGVFSKSLNFKFNDDKVKFDANYVDNVNDNYGSASGFAPKSLFLQKAPSGAFHLFLRTYPTTKHTTDLINVRL